MTTKFYANLSNAKRAAKAAGLDVQLLRWVQGPANDQGQRGWGWEQPAAPVAPKAPRYKLHRKPKAKPAPVVAAPVAAKVAPAETPKHKDFQVYSRSAVLSPVQFVHNFLAANGAKLSRKEALYELNKAGVNYATARTQYQRWFSANK